MALLEVSNLSKIYTTDGNISVGISNINLMFDKNEIVAITGESGSGKSTLLRVLGGLESYEEGEMYFKGLPTSHYNHQDWADYLNTNISFIFQEYNILESFTVLENVMYALTNIKNLKERKNRAKEILEKVGMKDRMKARGSQLSGGEKQRTVIARAIAKDSPIILADEPTGNLDSKTAKDIVKLLKDISKDKLVVIVTHNYEDFEEITTRHIRLYNGKVELDECKEKVEHVSSQKSDPFDFKEEREFIFKSKEKKKGEKGSFADVITLGAKRYISRPKQNILTTFLLIIASLLIFITCVALVPQSISSGDIISQPGRMLLVKRNGDSFYETKAEKLKAELGAKDIILFDSALDNTFYEGSTMPMEWEREKETQYKLGFDLNYKLDEGKPISKPGEVVLKIPYTLKGKYAIGNTIQLTGMLSGDDMFIGMGKTATFKSKIVGIAYYLGSKTIYVDAHKKDIQNIALSMVSNAYITLGYIDNYNSQKTMSLQIYVDESLTDNDAKVYTAWEEPSDMSDLHFVYGFAGDISLADPLDINLLSIKRMSDEERYKYNNSENIIKVSPSFYENVILNKSIKETPSKQISLYFDSADKAKNARNVLENSEKDEYLIYLAQDYTEPKPKLGMSVMLSIVVAIVISLVIVLSLVKIIAASKGEISIYRTMGISDNVIKGSTYVQVILDTIPSILIMVAAYFVCFFTKLGESLNFIPASIIALLCFAVFMMGIIVAIGFNRVIYKERINKELRRTNK